MIAIQVISVIAISALLIYMLFKGWNPIIAPLLAACLVAIFNGSNIMSSLADVYIPGFNQMITMFFPYMVKVAKKAAADSNGLLPACRTLINAIGSGAQDGGGAILLIASGSAFAVVLSASNGCAVIMGWAT